jgi:hypothetical protein
MVIYYPARQEEKHMNFVNGLILTAALLSPACDAGSTSQVPVVRHIAKRVKGRILGSLVKKGMTLEEVRTLLGQESGGTGIGTGAGHFFSMAYLGLGLSVDLVSDKEGVLRVNRVDFGTWYPTPQKPQKEEVKGGHEAPPPLMLDPL